MVVALDELATENAKLRADAARYRWIREFCPFTACEMVNAPASEFDGDEVLRDRLDKAIDAELSDQPQDEDCTCVGFHTGACKEGS